MKRFVMCAIFALLVLGVAFAEKTKIHSIGISVPIENQYWWNDDVLLDETFFNVGINLNYRSMSIHGESLAGFSAIYDIQLGFFFGETSLYNQSYNWFDFFNMKWGVGRGVQTEQKNYFCGARNTWCRC